MKRFLALCTLLAVAACGSEAPTRFEAAPVDLPERVRIAYGTVSVREASLPAYAAAEDITRLDATGQLDSAGSALWADDPTRAVTLGLATALNRISGAQVAPDPWPYRTRPEVIVDVRFETLVPRQDGTYRATGLYFVAPEQEDRKAHAHTFDLSVPYDPTGGVPALARGRAAVVNALALDIARSGLR